MTTSSNDGLKFENQFCFPLYSAANAMVRAYRPLLDALDITYLQYMVLMLLWEERQLNVKALGERLGLDSGTLTPLLKRLDGKGFVSRSRDPDDERVRLISITEQGLALRKKAQDIPGKLACRIDMKRADAKQFRQLCEQVLAALND